MVIYKITNKINGKIYVGQTCHTAEWRWKKHCSNRSSIRMLILRAIKKYGKNNFIVEEICQCQTQEETDRMERFYADKLNSFVPNGYNLLAGSGSGAMSEEVKRKISVANTGKIRTPEMIERLSKAHLGFKVSEETKRKISLKNKGRPTAEITKKRCSEVKSKHYDLIDPDGNIVHIFGMRQFCLQNKFSISKMCELARGKRAQYRGWKLK